MTTSRRSAWTLTSGAWYAQRYIHCFARWHRLSRLVLPSGGLMLRGTHPSKTSSSWNTGRSIRSGRPDVNESLCLRPCSDYPRLTMTSLPCSDYPRLTLARQTLGPHMHAAFPRAPSYTPLFFNSLPLWHYVSLSSVLFSFPLQAQLHTATVVGGSPFRIATLRNLY